MSSAGERVGGEGPPTLCRELDRGSRPEPVPHREGRPPVGPEEVVINRGALVDAGLEVGGTATILMPEPVEVKIVGSATFGDEEGAATSTFVAFSDAGVAAHIQKSPGTASQILVAGDGTLDQTQLRDSIRSAISTRARPERTMATTC